MSGVCFICDQQAGDVLVVDRFDGTTYGVPMCVVCLTETDLRSRPVRFAHELIDARNAYRTRGQRIVVSAR